MDAAQAIDATAGDEKYGGSKLATPDRDTALSHHGRNYRA